MKRLLLILTLASASLGTLWVSADTPNKPEGVEAPPGLAIATFAGGCFWCTESDFEKVPGVVEAISGFTGGKVKDPSYRLVASGATQHIESVQVHYDPTQITYEGLLAVYWRMFDPTDAGGSFVDRGHHYSSAIFYHSEAQRRAAEKSRDELARAGRYDKPIVTPIRPAMAFYKAEDYHQNYYAENPIRYTLYRYNSGRDQYLERTWGDDLKVDYAMYQPQQSQAPYKKPSDQVLRERLSPLQYKVTQEEGTERPFDNTYWDEKREGIYVDVVSGEPLFSSKDKFESGTGWPSFTRPLEEEHIVTHTDYKLIYPRTEVRSKYGDSHLGHVFKDGPEPTGLRYCINSAALKFIPKEELQSAGLGEYAQMFE